MTNIGFSTGSLSRGDFRAALQMIEGKTTVVELSTLRESEFYPLLNALDTLDLSTFQYISFHAPSHLVDISEEVLVADLQAVVKRGWYTVVHPDIITEHEVWKALGKHLCIENMDKRKGVGRTSVGLSKIFDFLPEASFCLDVAHARQVDPTMSEAIAMLMAFQHRLVQLHVSDLNSVSKHERLNLGAIKSYQKLAGLIPDGIPVILETPVAEECITEELHMAAYIFNKEAFEQGIGNALSRTAFYEYAD